MNTTAILITSFNRRDITIKCLKQLFYINNDIDVFLVDDNSTDGTVEAVLSFFPQVNIIKGSGNLFWNRGMHLAWQIAGIKQYNYYLLLNDDVLLYEYAFHEIFECSRITKGKAIISGVIESSSKNEILYGGSDKNKRIISPNGKMTEITFLNGNFVLIPKAVHLMLGNLDATFHHDLGDVDYGLRALKENIKVYTTTKPIGVGEKNTYCRVRLWNSNLKKRFKKLYSPLGNNPKLNFYFRHRHYGYANALLYYVHIHIINLLPDFIVKFLWNNKYTDLD